ncbi:MAG TPA: hypothetical protein VFD43_01895 [Planctomycetota bacterium]|nr:hypothetical protein [Planctomycetota bacterium]
MSGGDPSSTGDPELRAVRDAPAGLGYRTQSADTMPEIEAMQIQAWRAMEPWQKLREVEELCQLVDHLAIQGILMRYPGASADEVRKRLTALRYGRELSCAVNAWDPLEHGW